MYDPLLHVKTKENFKHILINANLISNLRYSNEILHYTWFGEKQALWKEFLHFGEYVSYDKFILYATATSYQGSVTAGSVSGCSYRTKHKNHILTFDMVGPVGFEPTTTPLWAEGSNRWTTGPLLIRYIFD